MNFKPVNSQVNFSEIDEELIKFWKENKIFEKSVESKPEDKRWTFLDGPPFVTGSPHYGSLLSSIPKDIFGRFWTMKGFRVRRVWGWDGHGLPIENKVENKLHIKRKKDIEESVGVKKFIDECLNYVDQVSGEWEWYIDHIGRWVDFKNAYKTWDMDYMESVMWVFKQMYDKGYIYRGLRVSLYCPHCATPISNFEVAMDADNYKEVTENASTYKYKLKDAKDTFILAWSTTPWNKIVTPALAVNPNLTYVKVRQGDEKYILAKSTLKILKTDPKHEVLEEFKGKDLLGIKFIPHYDFYEIEEGKKAFEIIGGEFVTADEGTGVVTIAVYGEEDLDVMNKENVQIVQHIDEEGMILPFVPKFGGMYYLDANEAVNKDLEERGLLYEEKPLAHSVAHCWRCSTRLFYAPKDAWFVDIQKLKPQLFKNNEPINWFPKHFKSGRFKKSMEQAPDWNISRNRYWGSPVPVWECECGERYVPGSVKELEERSGKKITNLHKPEIDEVWVKCKACGKQAKRVPEVLDSWIEAGSAPFGERHFPFDFAQGKPFEGEKLEDFFPSDFIVEYTGQIRAWFYVLHVIATALYDCNEFKNVLVTGVLLGTDGRKMSKNFGNFPDPKEVMQKYGGDALRIYLMGSPLMKGEDVNFSNDGVPETIRGFLLILWNCYKYFVDYANIFGWNEKKHAYDPSGENLKVLDRWILARLNELVLELNQSYEKYDTVKATKLIREFVADDFSTWYIRRSRDRVSNNENEKDRNVSLSVMHKVLTILSKVMAPLAPFISEEIFKNLTGNESVHLLEFPDGDKSMLDKSLINNMALVRRLVEKGHGIRKEKAIKLRQPLAKASYGPFRLTEDLEEIIAQELNVKKVHFTTGTTEGNELDIDTTITEGLAKEGEAREIIRNVQKLRREQGLTLNDLINLTLPFWPGEFKDLILKSTHSKSLIKGKEVKIQLIADPLRPRSEASS
ncbi:isoleucine--tRNA ligase [Candidatus Daviesbacteria bacterium]|nr:isoleucine--tRNA ligase [Candidatus Daviesbacteria bacterium]